MHSGNRGIEGPKTIEGGCDIFEIPVYVPAGAVVPLGPVIQSTGEQPGGELEVQVYDGADGSFDFVEDDGETILYYQNWTADASARRKGAFVRTTHFKWNHANR